MGLEESPSLNEYSLGLPSDSDTPDPLKKRKRTWMVIAILCLIILILASIIFIKSNPGTVLAGTGTITGKIVGDRNQPLEAEIIVLGTEIKTMSNPDGSFEIIGVPSGNRSVAVLYLDNGWEYPAVVNPEQVTHMGEIKFITTAEPDN